MPYLFSTFCWCSVLWCKLAPPLPNHLTLLGWTLSLGGCWMYYFQGNKLQWCRPGTVSKTSLCLTLTGSLLHTLGNPSLIPILFLTSHPNLSTLCLRKVRFKISKSFVLSTLLCTSVCFNCDTSRDVCSVVFYLNLKQTNYYYWNIELENNNHFYHKTKQKNAQPQTCLVVYSALQISDHLSSHTLLLLCRFACYVNTLVGFHLQPLVQTELNNSQSRGYKQRQSSYPDPQAQGTTDNQQAACTADWGSRVWLHRYQHKHIAQTTRFGSFSKCELFGLPIFVLIVHF